MTAQHTQPEKSIRQLAVAAQMMPWDKSQADVPFSQRYEFQQAITADHYLELLGALQNMLGAFDTPIQRRRLGRSSIVDEAIESARAAIQKATGGTHKEGA